VTESTKALELDPNYVKALMRRAQANESLDKFEEALSGMDYGVTETETKCPCRAFLEYQFLLPVWL
jgi:hypothetical protein